MGQADTFRYREDFRGRYGAVPTEIAPRLVLIHDFPVGRPGIPETTQDLNDLMREYSDGHSDFGTTFANVYSRQTFGGVSAGRMEFVRVVAGDAEVATSNAVTTGGGSTTPQFHLEAVGPGAKYNNLKAHFFVTRIIATGHPAGNNLPVFRVELEAPDRTLPRQIFENIVITQTEGNSLSELHQTYDLEAVLNDPSTGSNVFRAFYEPTANSQFGRDLAVGGSFEVVITGGTDGVITPEDWEDAIDACVELPFRHFVIPNSPTEAIRGYAVGALKQSDFSMFFPLQMYGENYTDFINARKAYGDLVQNGKDMMFWGWGEHILSSSREVSFAAAYLGRWSAKIAASGLGGEYPVGNEPLGYRSIAKFSRIKRPQQEELAALNINYAKQMSGGGFGVHGYWTLDGLVQRMGDAAKRSFWNDVLRRLAEAFIDLAQNRGNTTVTRDTIKAVGDAAIMPYIIAGYAETAATGSFNYDDVSTRFLGLTFPVFDYDWAYYLASIRFNPTLGGVFVHVSDQDIVGLANLVGAATTGAKPSGGSDTPAAS